LVTRVNYNIYNHNKNVSLKKRIGLPKMRAELGELRKQDFSEVITERENRSFPRGA
jgi:hypothetical protein